MRSFKRRALTSCSMLLLSTAFVSGCAATTPITTILGALDCASLIPPSYRQQVRPVPLIQVGATVGDATVALDGQTARLDQANGRTADVIAIADACQARQAKVLAELKPRPWWVSLFRGR